jgi:hypothetical protein
MDLSYLAAILERENPEKTEIRIPISKNVRFNMNGNNFIALYVDPAFIDEGLVYVARENSGIIELLDKDKKTQEAYFERDEAAGWTINAIFINLQTIKNFRLKKETAPEAVAA